MLPVLTSLDDPNVALMEQNLVLLLFTKIRVLCCSFITLLVRMMTYIYIYIMKEIKDTEGLARVVRWCSSVNHWKTIIE